MLSYSSSFSLIDSSWHKGIPNGLKPFIFGGFDIFLHLSGRAIKFKIERVIRKASQWSSYK